MYKTSDNKMAVDLKIPANYDLKQTIASLCNIQISKVLGNQLDVEQKDSDTQKIKKSKLGPVPVTVKAGNPFVLKNTQAAEPATVRFLVAA